MDGSAPDVLSPLLQYGPLGIMTVMLLFGFLVPKWVYDAMKTDRDKWQSAAEKEQDAHDVTRQVVRDLAAREGASTELGKTALGILQGLDHTARGGS